MVNSWRTTGIFQNWVFEFFDCGCEPLEHQRHVACIFVLSCGCHLFNLGCCSNYHIETIELRNNMIQHLCLSQGSCGDAAEDGII